jgi:transcriptional regulator NrdR family protein
MPKFICPECNESDTYVAQTLDFIKRLSKLRRRRRCPGCGFVFYSVEVLEEAYSRKVKRQAKKSLISSRQRK